MIRFNTLYYTIKISIGSNLFVCLDIWRMEISEQNKEPLVKLKLRKKERIYKNRIKGIDNKQ